MEGEWYRASSSSGVFLLDAGTRRCRVAPGVMGASGWSARVCADDSEEAFHDAKSLGQFPTCDEAKAACIAELTRIAPAWRRRAVLQDWVQRLTFMQQTVLLTAIRGPDGLPKYGATKMLLRWFRRCTLVSAMDGRALATPHELGGGSFTGPSIDVYWLKSEVDALRRDEREAARARLELVDEAYDATEEEALAFADQPGVWERHMDRQVDNYLRELDAIPHHFQLHFLHAAEIVGYKHPDTRIRAWWAQLYERLVHDMHLYPESEAQMDSRLGDNRSGWLERADPATQS